MATIVNNIQEALEEINKQRKELNFNMHNYALLDKCNEYLSISESQCREMGEDFDEKDQLFNFLAYDLGWEERAEELFPMSL